MVILDLLESESNRDDDREKYNRVDLLAKTDDGERIIVEVQYLSEMAYLRRLAYGTARPLVETLKLGEPYTNLKKVYSINPVTLKKSLVGDQVRIGETNIFPEYYLIPLKRFTDVIRDDLDQWVYALFTGFRTHSLLYFDVSQDGDDYIYHGKTGKNNEVLDEFSVPGIGALKEKFDYLKMDEQGTTQVREACRLCPVRMGNDRGCPTGRTGGGAGERTQGRGCGGTRRRKENPRQVSVRQWGSHRDHCCIGWTFRTGNTPLAFRPDGIIRNLITEDLFHEDLSVRYLRLRLRGGEGSTGCRYPSGDQVGRRTRYLGMSRLRCRQGRLRDDGDMITIGLTRTAAIEAGYRKGEKTVRFLLG